MSSFWLNYITICLSNEYGDDVYKQIFLKENHISNSWLRDISSYESTTSQTLKESWSDMPRIYYVNVVF